MTAIGSIAYAAANGTLLATPTLAKITLPMNCASGPPIRSGVR